MLAVVLGVLLLARAGAADESSSGPFSNVPTNHWAYRSASLIAQEGIFTGYPDDTLAGQRVLTRYEFAVAIQRMVPEIQRRRLEGSAFARPLHPHLVKLSEEFSPELAMLGVDLTILRYHLLRLTSPWRTDAPDLAQAPVGIYPGVGTPEDPEYQRGYWLAVQEWQRGEVVFYVAPDSTSPRISPSTGVLYRILETRRDEPGRLALLAGHNAEVKRRLARFGLPTSAHPTWVEPITSPAQPWKTGAPRVQLDALRREANSADGQVLLRLEEQRPGQLAVLRVTTLEQTRELTLADFDPSRDTLEVCWSPRAELFHLAIRRPDHKQARISVVNLKSGETLHQVTLPATELQPASGKRVQKIYPFLEADR